MQNEKQHTVSDEISLADTVDFFKRNLMVIVLCGIAGLLFSTIYLVQTPKKYEVLLQMQMAQFVNSNNNNSISISNSEEPVALIQRLRIPTTYPVDVQQSCGVVEGGEFGEYLDGRLKANIVKSVINSVEMKVSAFSADQAKKCTESIVAMIVAQQRSLIEERLAGRQLQLAQYQQALREERQQLEMIKKSDLGNFGYLAKLDKLSWLRTRIDALQEEAMLSQMHPAKLIAPIYVPNKPVSPKVGLVLFSGLTLGLMLGLLYAMGCEGWRRVE